MFKLEGIGRDAARTTGAPCQRGVHFDSPGGGNAFGAVETNATQGVETTWVTGTLPVPVEITQPMWDVEGDTAAIATSGTQGAPLTQGTQAWPPR
jgi:hypothetical protein